MTFALSPAATNFVTSIHNQQVVERFQNIQRPFEKTDLLRSHRLSSLVFTSTPPNATGDSSYRLYDPISNAFLDCVTYETNDLKMVKVLTEYHPDETVHHQWGYNNNLNIIPLVMKFEERVATRYYKKFKDYLPVIETYELDVKNHLVSILREFMRGGATTQELRLRTLERSSEIEAMSKHFRPKEQEGSSANFVRDSLQTLKYPNTVLEFLLTEMLKRISGYQFFTGTKSMKDDLDTAMVELVNVCSGEGQVMENTLVWSKFNELMTDGFINFGMHNTTQSCVSAIKAALKKICDESFEKRLADKNDVDKEITTRNIIIAIQNRLAELFLMKSPVTKEMVDFRSNLISEILKSYNQSTLFERLTEIVMTRSPRHPTSSGKFNLLVELVTGTQLCFVKNSNTDLRIAMSEKKITTDIIVQSGMWALMDLDI